MNRIMTNRINAKYLDNCETLISLRGDLFPLEKGIIKPFSDTKINAYIIKEANAEGMEILCRKPLGKNL